MTKEETLTYLKAYLDGDTAIGNIIPLRSVLESALEYLEPSLPSNLDEAAHSYSESDEPLYSPGHRFHWDNESLFGKQIETTFKAGAEWMAGQGVSFDTEISWLDSFGFQIGWPEDTSIFDCFNSGDKVVVQIRKKQ